MSEENVSLLMKKLDDIVKRTSVIDERLTQIEKAKSKEQINATLLTITKTQNPSTSTAKSSKTSKYLYTRPAPPETSYNSIKSSKNEIHSSSSINSEPKLTSNTHVPIHATRLSSSAISSTETPIYESKIMSPTEYDQVEYSNDFLSQVLAIIQDIRTKVTELAEEQIQMREDIKQLKQKKK